MDDGETAKRIYDQQYLKTVQYGTSANLEARIQIHRLYATNPTPWQHWVLDQVEMRSGMQALEVGCGPADLWRDNLPRLPQGVRVVAGDLSHGMALQARRNMHQASQGPAQNNHPHANEELRIDIIQVDAQHLPFPGKFFDRVFANHMLYHVPDIHQALSELSRTLKPGGVFCAATNGYGHMRQLNELAAANFPGYQGGHRNQIRRFALENAQDLLAPFFRKTELRIYKAHLQVTQVDPLLAYLASLWDIPRLVEPAVIERIARQVQQEIDRKGFFLIEKSQGLVLAS